MSPSLSLLVWFDQHPLVYLAAVSSLLGLTVAVTVRPLLQGKPDDVRRHDWRWSLPILAILFGGRWPALIFPRELNVDESQLLAGAHTLAHDPVFWRSVSGGTAGPLDFFALWPAGWGCGWDTFLTARLTALLLVGASLILAHQCLALLTGRTVARVAVLAGLGLEALTNAGDLLHYSSELVPMVLLAGAAYTAVRRWTGPDNPIWCGVGGLLLGAVPFGKLQPAPLALAIGLTWLWFELRTPSAIRQRVYLVAGALVPAAWFAGQLTFTGEWTGFVQSYVLFNLQYAGEGRASLGQAMEAMLGNALHWDSLLPVVLLGVVLWMAVLVRVRPCADRALRILTWAAVAGCTVAVACIVAPKRPYLHYWQLLIIPGQLLLGALLARSLSSLIPASRRREQLLAAGAAVLFTGLLLVHRVRYPNLFVGDLAYFQGQSRSDLARRVTAHAHAGEAIAIWGRADTLYVETGLRQGTRASHTGPLIEAGPLRDYFRARYLDDMVARKPATFVDAVGAASAQYRTADFAHERIFPELAQVVAADYVLVEEFQGARIYRRRDPPGR